MSEASSHSPGSGCHVNTEGSAGSIPVAPDQRLALFPGSKTVVNEFERGQLSSMSSSQETANQELTLFGRADSCPGAEPFVETSELFPDLPPEPHTGTHTADFVKVANVLGQLVCSADRRRHKSGCAVVWTRDHTSKDDAGDWFGRERLD